ncbi:MAG: ATP-binding cassette domain-containing protein [Anaerolineales bacterium]|nr:ATP-binding cassette domain-containing protein [Anaerolineales bacterium]
MLVNVISIENLSKAYQLGVIGTGTFFGDLNRWWARKLGRPDPYAKIGVKDHGNRIGEMIQALDDVSFTVKKGEALGIIGRNGAGKSTLLKILSQVTAPTSGVVKVKGRIASLLEVGTGFHPELTGRENIYLNGAILGMNRLEVARKFDEIVDFSGVEKFIDTPVKRYSSGMYVRLAFAVAAHLEPDILVVDEVLAVGDAEFQKKCLGKMGSVADEGRTVLFVSHNMSAINRLCSRAILLDAGTLIKDGTANEVTAQYLQGADIEEGRRWALESAPGNEDLKLLSVKLTRMGENSAASVVEVKDDLILELEYFVKKANMRFRCNALFYSLGVCAFASIEPKETLHEKAGRYISKVHIPAHLLAETEYTVSISMFSSLGVKQHFVKVQNALNFQVFDSMTAPSARGDYAENLVSAVRPMLDWETSYTDSQPN